MKSTSETKALNPDTKKDRKPMKALIVILGVFLLSGGVGYAVGRFLYQFSQ